MDLGADITTGGFWRKGGDITTGGVWSAAWL
jgi:hypothetical protein